MTSIDGSPIHWFLFTLSCHIGNFKENDWITLVCLGQSVQASVTLQKYSLYVLMWNNKKNILLIFSFATNELNKVGLYVAAKPLSPENYYFEIEIVDTGLIAAIGKFFNYSH